jgi:hypothetical protein
MFLFKAARPTEWWTRAALGVLFTNSLTIPYAHPNRNRYQQQRYPKRR